MLPVTLSSLLGIFFYLHIFPSISAVPLETQRVPSSTLSKRSNRQVGHHLSPTCCSPTLPTHVESQDQVLVCPGPLPLPPYPQAPIYMKAARIDPETQSPTALIYTDAWGEEEHVFAREGLCTRAGCECIYGALVCNNFEYLFFSRVLYNWSATGCMSTCTCKGSTPQSVSSGG